MNYEIGDIIWVSEFSDKILKNVNHHLFVVIDDDGQVVPMDYFGLIISSHIEKSKYNSKYRYNEPLDKNNKNNLKDNSIVKCDQVYIIPKCNIRYKIGTVDTEDMIRFLNALKQSIK